MEFIQCNMPVLVDGAHFCVRVREIQCECDEICTSQKSENKEQRDDEYVKNQSEENNDDGGEGYDEGGDGLDEENDGLFDDGSDIELLFGGRWIRGSDDEIDSGNNGNLPENSNIPDSCESQTQGKVFPYKENVQNVSSSPFV